LKKLRKKQIIHAELHDELAKAEGIKGGHLMTPVFAAKRGKVCGF